MHPLASGRGDHSHQQRMVRRPDSPPVSVTERDQYLLQSIGKLRFVTTGQVLRLRFASSRSAANKRLRRLFDAGLLRVWVRCLEEENLYALTLAGRAALIDGATAGDNARALHVPRGLDRDLDHTLAINDVRIALATTLPLLDAELLSWRSDWDLRGHGPAHLVPDARFGVRWSDGNETAFSLEVDRNTKSASALLRKLLVYRAAAHSLDGASAVVVLVVVHSPAWLHRYRLRLGHAGLRLPVWFATLADVGAHGAVGAIWRAADSDARSGAPVLTALPNGSEGRTLQTAAATGADAPAAARVPLVLTADERINDHCRNTGENRQV